MSLWWLIGKESTCQTGGMVSIPESRRAPGGGNGNPLQDCCLGISMDRGGWRVRKSTLNIHWKGWWWNWRSNTFSTWCGELTLENTLMMGKIEGKRRRGQQRMRWLDGFTDSWTWVWASAWQEFMGSGSQTWLSDWTETMCYLRVPVVFYLKAVWFTT